MSLTRSRAGKPKPRGIWFPQRSKPEYYVLRDFTKTLGAEQIEVLAVLLRIGARLWQNDAGHREITDELATYRVQPPCEAHLPPISA
jgi:hypothetical protein